MSVDQKPEWFEYERNPQEPDDYQLRISNVAEGPPIPPHDPFLHIAPPPGTEEHLQKVKQALEHHEKKLRLVIIHQFAEKLKLESALLELCWEIEELPAGEQQTKVSVMANDLKEAVAQLLKEMEAEADVTHQG